MASELRKTGIDPIGDVPWGTHFCQFYRTKQDLIDILVPYFKTGLENNELCMWVTAEPLSAAEARQAITGAVPDFRRYLDKGQIEIIPYNQWYLLGGTFNDDRVLAGWVKKLNQALEKGYSGLRLTGKTFWLERNHWRAFTEYEAKVNDAIGKYKMLAICTYCLDKCDGAAVIDVVKNHQFALIKQAGKWDIIESAIYRQAKEALKESEALSQARDELEMRVKEHTRELKNSEDKYRQIVETASEGIWTADPEGKLLFVNQRMAQMLGYSVKEMIGRNASEFRAKGQEPRVLRQRARLKQGKTIEDEIQFRRKDGSAIWMEANASPIYDAEGNHVANLAMLTDITERKRAEAELAHLASFPELNPNPIVELDTAGNIRYLNPVAKRLFPDMLATGSKHPYLAGWENMLARLQNEKPQSINREVNIGNCWYWQTLAYAPASQGICFYSRDITERKQAEEALQEARDELETRVKERTEELLLANARLKEENEERLRSEQSLRLEQARLDALLQLSQMSEATVNEMAGFILEHGIALTQSKIGFVGFLNEDETVYTLNAVSKDVIKECNVVGDPLQWHIAEAGIWANAIRQRRTLFMNDYSKPHPSKKGLPPGHPPVSRLMVVPLLDGKRIVAVAGMGNKACDYDKSDERQITLLLSGMWNHVQSNQSRKALQEAHDKLEQRVGERTAELAASNAALQDDITQRKQAEEALAREKELLQTITENTDAMLAYFDTGFNFVRVNSAYARGSGHPAEELIGKNHFELFPDEDNEKIFKQVRDSGKAVAFRDKPFSYKDQPERGITYWDWTLTPVTDTWGNVQGLVLSLVDTTKRVRLESEMRIKEQAIASSITPIVIADLKGYITYVNPSFLTMWGDDDASDILGRNVTDFRGLGKEVQKIMAAVKSNGYWMGEIANRQKDGLTIHIQIAACLVNDQAGKPICIMASLADITERKRLEELKDDFIGMVSHELRTPLTVVMGGLGTIMSERNRLSPAETEELLRDAYLEAETLDHLLGNLLELSRAQANRLSLNMEPVRIDALVGNVVERIKRQTSRHQFSTEIPDSLSPVNADPLRLERILYNLLDNAVKYSPDGGEVRIFARKDGANLLVGVADQGIGISSQDQTRLFAPFQRVEHSATRYGGTGLGLVVCRRLVEAHGGRIWVESQPGRGSTFVFSLPSN
jgi:PAS domain S-box-containing protein